MCLVLPEGMCTVECLGMQEFERFLVDLHILPKGDRRSLCPRYEMAPAPRLAGGVKFFHHGLMMPKGMHCREAIVADNLGEPRNESRRVVATVDILLGELHRDFPDSPGFSGKILSC